MRTTNYSRTTHGIRRCTSRRSGGCGLPALASTIEPQPWRMVPTSSGSGLGITANTTDSLAVSNRNETPNHALQRTGAAVTPAASAAAFPSAAQRSRQPRPSLSLGSLGHSAPVFFNQRLKPMNNLDAILGIIMNDIREVKVRAWLAQKLAERLLIHHGESSEDVAALVAQLKAEADSTFLRELQQRVEKLAPDLPDDLRRSMGLN